MTEQNNKISQYSSLKITIISFICSIFVVTIHTYNVEVYLDAHKKDQLVKVNDLTRKIKNKFQGKKCMANSPLKNTNNGKE